MDKVQRDSLKRLMRLTKRFEDDQDNDFDPFAPLDELNGNANMSFTRTPSTQTCKKCKKRSRNEDPIVGVLKDSVSRFDNIQTKASDSIRILVDCFKFEADATTRRMKEFDELKIIEGLTVVQRKMRSTYCP